MQPRHVAQGATIFHLGDPSDAVYVIESGEVAITIGHVEVARLFAGALFGESGVLESRPRAATATAITGTTLLVTDAGTFLHAFGLDNDRALTLVKLLCRRLRDANDRAAHVDTTPALAAPIRLLPDHDHLTGRCHMRPVDIRHLPFTVGNRFGGETVPFATDRACVIAAHGETDLGSPHFELLRRDGQIMVHDLASRHGTIVNGMPINRTTLEGTATLHAGDNIVIAGRANSPFRFRVHLTA